MRVIEGREALARAFLTLGARGEERSAVGGAHAATGEVEEDAAGAAQTVARFGEHAAARLDGLAIAQDFAGERDAAAFDQASQQGARAATAFAKGIG